MHVGCYGWLFCVGVCLFVARLWSFVVYWSACVARCLLIVVSRLLFVVVVCGLLFLFFVCRLPVVVYSVSCEMYCLLCGV